MNERIRIIKRDGVWKVFFVYFADTEAEYIVFMDEYTSLEEAHSVSMMVAEESVNV